MQPDGTCIIKCQTCRATEWCGVWARVKVHAGYNGHLLYGWSYERIQLWVVGRKVITFRPASPHERRSWEHTPRLTSGLTPLPNTGRAAIICSEPRVHAIKANVCSRHDLFHLKLTCLDSRPLLCSIYCNASRINLTHVCQTPTILKIDPCFQFEILMSPNFVNFKICLKQLTGNSDPRWVFS